MVPPLERLREFYSQPLKFKPMIRKPVPKPQTDSTASGGVKQSTFGNTKTGYIPPWWKGEQAAYQSAKKAMGGISSLPKMKK